MQDGYASPFVDLPPPSCTVRQPSPSPSPTDRRHDLDALRAFAMLLGIVLHATSAYRGVKAPVTDVFSSPDLIFDEAFHAIHGFRMQLFFLISGFFTMLLQQRLGWGGMLRQRAVRIALPLAVGTVTIVRLTRWTKVELASQAWLDRRNVALDGGIEIRWIGPFGELWFLWFLVLFVSAFALVSAASPVGLARWLKTLPSPVIAAIAFAVTWGAQYSVMAARSRPRFAMPAPLTVLPEPQTLLYYGTFFFVGIAVRYVETIAGRPLLGTQPRAWLLLLPGSVVFFFALDTTFEGGREDLMAAALLQTLYAWLMVGGLLGLFSTVIRGERPSIRYLSDSSYWLYLAHPPLVVLGQWYMRNWELSTVAKFALLNLSVTALLLASYAVFVRHTPIGWVLNGRRRRTALRDRSHLAQTQRRDHPHDSETLCRALR